MITLKSCNGETFEVEESVVLQFQAIWYMFEDLFADPDAHATIPLPNVSSEILAMVIKYCKHHVDAVDKDLKSFDADFLNVDQGTLFDLILAANYLNIKDLLDLTCQTVADMISGKTPEEIRGTFNIRNDFTPEEEDEICTEKKTIFSVEDIISLIGDKCDGVIGQLTEDWEETLFSALSRAGGNAFSNMAGGYTNVNIDAATKYGVAVGNTHGVLTETTAE